MAWVDIDYARSIVKQMYASDTWRSRVRGMSDDQVLAIYYRYEEKIEREKAMKAYSAHKDKKDTVEAVKEVKQDRFISDYAEQLSLGGVL